MYDLSLSFTRSVGQTVAQWLERQTWDLKVESSSPGRCTHVVCLGKTLGTSKLLIGKPDKMLGGNLRRWTSIPSRGSRNTPSRFILQKLEISAKLSGSPNYDWGRLYLYLYLHKKALLLWLLLLLLLVQLCAMISSLQQKCAVWVLHVWFHLLARIVLNPL